jgi:protein-tyrosine phosphatase
MRNIKINFNKLSILIIPQFFFIGCKSTFANMIKNNDYVYCKKNNEKLEKSYPKCSQITDVNQICILSTSDLRPTQFNIGQEYVNTLFKKVTNNPQRIKNLYCDKPFDIVVGPDSENGFFVIDGHHRLILANELYKNKNYEIKLLFKVKKNYMLEKPKISKKEFWIDMKNNNFVYLKDKGESKDFNELPKAINNLTNDPYRSLVGFIADDRSKFCFDKNLESFSNYAEFYWADYFRKFNGLIKYEDFTSYKDFKNKIIYFNINKNNIIKNICKIKLASDLPGYTKQDNIEGTLVVDEYTNIHRSPKNFRSSEQILMHQDLNKIGVDNLHISGSAQFSKEELRWIINNTKKNILVVDLRQEPHGFINNYPVTWTNNNNWINIDQLKNNILIDEAHRLRELYDLKYIQIPRAKDYKNGTINKNGLVRFDIVSAEREDQIVNELKAKYFRITVSDHNRPSDSDVDEFLKLVKNLDSNTWIHFHCRGGKGRTTTFLLMFDILKNAKSVSYDDILKRQTKIFPIYIYHKKNAGKYKELYREREQFIKEFYLFSKNYISHSDITWSQWKNIKKN